MKQIVSARNGQITKRDLTAQESAQRTKDAADAVAYVAPAAREARLRGKVNQLFQGSDALLAKLVREIAIDVAKAKGITPAQYRDDLINRLK